MTVIWNDLCGLVRERVAVNEGLWARGRVYDRQGNELAEEWSELGPGNGRGFVRYLRRVAFGAAT
jgi:hypothetical protein